MEKIIDKFKDAIYRLYIFLNVKPPYQLATIDPIYRCPHCGESFIIRGYDTIKFSTWKVNEEINNKKRE